jgi:hypothetical protein
VPQFHALLSHNEARTVHTATAAAIRAGKLLLCEYPTNICLIPDVQGHCLGARAPVPCAAQPLLPCQMSCCCSGLQTRSVTIPRTPVMLLLCRVIAWEPVPQFRALLSHNLARNRLSHLVTVRPTVVADPPGTKQVRPARI